MSALAPTLQSFFTSYLIGQRGASEHTIAAYRDTLRLLLRYAHERTGVQPSDLDIGDLDAELIAAFLAMLEQRRANGVRTRNARLAAIHSLYRHAALRHPEHEGYSTVDNPEEEALARPWIEPLWPQWRVRKHRLGDLYVRFWRVGPRKITEFTGRGVVCFISNRKWLGGRSFPAMRGDIAARFDKVVIDDLHGDVRAQQAGDGSVFTTATAAGIRVGVAITTAVRTGPRPEGSFAEVRGRDLQGSGAAKRQQLRALADHR